MSKITIHTFHVDATPPVGDYLCGSLHARSVGLEQKLSLRGLVFSEGEKRYVIAAVEFCYLCGRSQRRLEDALAAGAKTTRDCVALQSVHTHDAPLVDEEAHAVMASAGPGSIPGVHNEAWFESLLMATRDGVAKALTQPGVESPGVALVNHKVDQFASSRRVLDENGKCHVRWSVCRDEKVRNAPEGKIDPLLDQLVFFTKSGDPFTAVSFYASHPQVSDGRQLISGDTPGLALDLFTGRNKGVFPVYFTGCAGDITAGKYTTTHRDRNRLVFGVRLFDGMQGAFEKAKPQAAVESLGWADTTFDMPMRKIPESLEHFEGVMRDSKQASSTRYLAAMKVFRLRDGAKTYPFRVSRLRLNDIHVVLGPTELVVEYQFFAKSLKPGKLVMAAYGDSFLKYVATDEMFDQGGYEIDPLWSEVDRGCEGLIKDAIRKVVTTP